MFEPFEIIEHPADVGFMAYGATLDQLFENAALAMMSLAGAVENIQQRQNCGIQSTGGNTESLLFAWLAEILAIADAQQLAFCRARVTHLEAGGNPAAECRVTGVVWGEPHDRSRHRAGTYIKAVTYHQLRIEQTPGGWSARVFLDV